MPWLDQPPTRRDLILAFIAYHLLAPILGGLLLLLWRVVH
jgi:hypothetical protein